jgi:hypothetical protein
MAGGPPPILLQRLLGHMMPTFRSSFTIRGELHIGFAYRRCAASQSLGQESVSSPSKLGIHRNAAQLDGRTWWQYRLEI